MRTRVSTKGQIVLPAELRERDGILPGQEIDIERIDRGEYRLVLRPRGNRAQMVPHRVASQQAAVSGVLRSLGDERQGALELLVAPGAHSGDGRRDRNVGAHTH
jgi:AbrB family looped-hinge helix DNA binding protein